MLTMMVQKSKWIRGVDADAPVTAVARQALEWRLELVWHYLRRAGERHPDPEDVHQLRVATRRAAATVEAYRDLLSAKRHEWFANALDKIRKAAGDARDFDVLLMRLDIRLADEIQEHWKLLGERIQQLRKESQKPIRKISRRMHAKDYLDRVEALADRIAWRVDDQPEPSFGQAARARLQGLAAPFFTAGKGDLLDIESLHQFRILGKALRYGIEIFSAAMASEMRREVYPLIVQLQEKLGQINDHASAVTRFQTWASEWNEPELADALETLVIEEKTALQESRRDFQTWWTQQRALELEDRFQSSLRGDVADVMSA